MLQQILPCVVHILSIISFIHNTDKQRCCSIGMKLFYFLIMQFTIIILIQFCFFTPFLPFYIFKFFSSLVSFVFFLWNLQFHIRLNVYFTLWPRQYYSWQHNYIDYVLLSCAKNQSEAATSSIATMLNCIHAHDVSNNLNVKVHYKRRGPRHE